MTVSDLHALPLTGHDLPHRPEVRAKVFATSPAHWYWSFLLDYGEGAKLSTLRHGPFDSQPEAFNSAHRMVELL